MSKPTHRTEPEAVVRVALWVLVKLFRLSARGFDALATRTETLREWLSPSVP